MRIVVVSAWEPWRPDDAAAMILREQLRLLAPRHDLTVIAAGGPAEVGQVPASAASEFPGVRFHWHGTGRSRVADYAARQVAARRSGEPGHVGYVERPGLLRDLDAALTSRGPAVVHLHGWGTAALAARCRGVPTVHNAVDPWWINQVIRRVGPAHRLTASAELAAIRAHECRHYPAVGAVVVLTESDAERLAEYAPGARIDVIPNGVHAGPPPMAPPAAPVLGFHGSFDSQANVDAATTLVRELLPLVRRGQPDVTVRLVGRRPPAEVQRLRAPDVVLCPDVTDMRAELDAMTVHVDWFTSGAGMKNKVLEAMSAGRPVVASPLGAAGIGDGAGLRIAPTVEAAAAAISPLLADRAGAEAEGRRGRERVEQEFSWAINVARLETLWSNVAARVERP